VGPHLLLVLAAVLAGDSPSARVERRVVAMGTWLSISVGGEDRAAALAASERAVREIQRIEAMLSTWVEDSELARLNRSPVLQPFPISPELRAILAQAQGHWRDTGGAFDPGIGGLIRAWDLRGEGRRPEQGEISSAIEGGGLAALELSPEGAIRRHERLCLEEGGFGKGAGLDAAIAAIASAGAREAVLDLGGQVAVLGAKVRLAVADPDRRDRVVAEIEIEHGSLSTTGNSERGVAVEGERLSHVLDPRTGNPASDFGSLTVWCASAMAADCLSTGLYVMGPDAALAWARDRAGIEVLVLERAGDGLHARATDGLKSKLRLVEGLVTEKRTFGDGL
jgi:thiamine biosynthesis lipoprotein